MAGRLDSGNHERLTRILNGDYWKEILWRDDASAEEQHFELIRAYCDQISRYLPVTRYCPVRESVDSRIKYFIVFASRHIDALVLMNDGMAQAYHSHMHRQNHQGGLFADVDWRTNRSINGFADNLEPVIVEMVTRWPGQTRKALWVKIVDAHFAEYTETEYRQAIKRLEANGTIVCERDPNTKRVNDFSRVWLRGRLAV